METPIFQEQQRYFKWWIITILLTLNAGYFYYLYSVHLSEPISENSGDSNFVIIIGVAFVFILSGLIRLALDFAKLDTKIYKDYIEIKFFPYFRMKKIYFNELDKIEVVKKSDIMEYNVRTKGLKHKNTFSTYRIRGDFGLKLLFKNQNEMLIGTQKPEELEEALKSIVN